MVCGGGQSPHGRSYAWLRPRATGPHRNVAGSGKVTVFSSSEGHLESPLTSLFLAPTLRTFSLRHLGGRIIAKAVHRYWLLSILWSAL